MEHARPLTKRPRASLACNACRQTKSKCDSNRPTCERCAKCGAECVYTQSGRDKRMDRQEERKANLALRSRVRELEAQLAAAGLASQHAQPNVASFYSQTLDRDKSPAQMSHAAVSDVGSADAIATGLFDHPPVVDIGYFGASSNHAFFWSLSASVENVSHRSAHRYQEPLRQGQHGAAEEQPQQLAMPAVPASNHLHQQLDDDSFPGCKAAVEWTVRFFDTVGAVLPYISKPHVLREIDYIGEQGQDWQAARRSLQALLSIIFAQALHTMEDRSPEPFYRRALGLLNEQTLYLPTVESLQALLLLASFQQNTQRSMESWTPHYLAVRLSYQLGIQAPASYEYLDIQDKEIRSRLWFAVVNQDRILTAGLARPCLIPLQYVRMDLAEFLDPSSPKWVVDTSCSPENLIYFRHIISLHEIMGTTVDSIYSSNISSSSRLALGDLVAKTIDLSWRPEQWRQSVAPAGIITSNADFSTWSPRAFEKERYKIMLSIFHYRTMMLFHGSLLMRVLERVTSSGQDASSGVLQDSALSLLKNYLLALKEWLQLIQNIVCHRRSFLTCNAVWWTCNYMMLSTCIHSFGFWLLSSNIRPSLGILGMNSADIEVLLRGSLDTIKALGGTSIMIRKAHRCLNRYLHFLKRITPGDDDQNEPDQVQVPAAFPDAQYIQPQADEILGQEFAPDMIESCVDDFLGGVNQEDFLDTGFLGMGQGISDFDAAGFI
ncbi:Oleate activated transcription factor 3 [Tolypocladium ophioglossoides CBS 100239]|uniref:Oleate activated transcription factor 3 n=1 Tax=Tolypocladium ophioglossoides (strain CBS 100239) TaxID=1163406 RepID=A0A0L0NEC0_TOLOC|nr:Oleate activated transcription factor 3 [Tolypocladium ophioglossoides CBS 100239]